MLISAIWISRLFVWNNKIDNADIFFENQIIMWLHFETNQSTCVHYINTCLTWSSCCCVIVIRYNLNTTQHKLLFTDCIIHTMNIHTHINGGACYLLMIATSMWQRAWYRSGCRMLTPNNPLLSLISIDVQLAWGIFVIGYNKPDRGYPHVW